MAANWWIYIHISDIDVVQQGHRRAEKKKPKSSGCACMTGAHQLFVRPVSSVSMYSTARFAVSRASEEKRRTLMNEEKLNLISGRPSTERNLCFLFVVWINHHDQPNFEAFMT